MKKAAVFPNKESGAKKPGRPKHIPQRLCVGCREALAKRALIRVVRGPDGVRIDPGGKAPGRGAYIHDRRACWEQALQGPLARALKTEFSASEREALETHMRKLESEGDDVPAIADSSGGTA
jgi:predicted RNA-binding protein YlxR (DUF448 family)